MLLMKLELYCDGASRGNPGPAATGGFILADGQLQQEYGSFLGIATNNEAEYRALVEGLEAIADILKNISTDRQEQSSDIEIYIKMDSELIVRQLNGSYKVKKEELKPFYRQARSILEGKKWQAEHIRREYNKKADELANQALNRHISK